MRKDLKQEKGQCFALQGGECEVLLRTADRCDYTCPFYKPQGFEDWLRIGDELMTAEAYLEMR